MKKILSLGLFFIGLTAATDTFRFTQCECISDSNSFLSDEQDDFTTLTKPSGVFSCPGSGTFPDNSGLLFNSPVSGDPLKTSTLATSFFHDGNNLKGWHAVMSVSLILPDQSSGSTSFDLLKVKQGNSVLATFTIDINGDPNTPSVISIVGSRNVEQEGSIGSNEATLIVGMAKVIRDVATNQLENDFFVCLKLGTNDLECNFAATAITVAEITSPEIELFIPVAGPALANPMTISMVQFGNGLAEDIVAPGLNDIRDGIAAKFAGFTLPTVVSLPVEGSVTLETEEDTPSSVNLTSLLTGGSLDGNTLTLALDVDSPPGDGTLDDTNLPIVLYTPNKDFNGDDSIAFTYSISSPFECSNTVSSSITVTPVNDPPVAVDSQVQVFANIPQEINVEVGTDVDQADDTFVGNITFTNPGQLPGVISAACDPLTAITTLSNVNGNVTFCFAPDGTMTNGNDATLSFTVEDGGGLSDSGDMTLVGNNPVFPPEDSPFETGTEDQELDFSLGNDKFGLKAEGAAGSVTIGIRVTKLPDEAIGTLTNSNGDAIVVGESSADFDVTDSLKFTPASKVFNTVKGRGEDESEVRVGDCSSRVTVNGESVCPFSFEYTVFLDNVQSDPKEAFFLIDAVDNGNPVITVNGGKEALVEANGLQLVNGLAIASVSGVAISSDDGADVFLMDMKIEGFGTSFLVKPPDNRAGYKLSDGAPGDDPNCENTLCSTVRVTGVPAQLASVANNLDVRVPQDSTAPAVLYKVDTLGGNFNIGQDVRIEITLNFKEPEFFDSTANLAAVGGGAGILVLSLTVFLIFRITRANRIGEANILQLAEAQVGREELEKRQKKKRAKESSRKTEYEDVESSRKKETSVEDTGFMDWEKHIDKETNETYFFNPKTGESRWDPPNMDDGI